MSRIDDPMRDLLDRIADGVRIDWAETERAHAADPELLRALRTLDDVRDAYRHVGAAPPAGAVLFRWGPLAVLEKVGEGASAEVFRAWDAGLATDVALKLLRPDAAAAGLRSEEFLREGALLAKLAHRNVLRVYGAAIHDGRPGLWAEWIEGRTLEAVLAEDGPLAAAEALHVGTELCAALAAIHAAGAIHGDVKAANVMRALGGRIVLTDLGAGGAPAAVNASLTTQATPAYLSPEARAGTPRSAADDLYALGVLLHVALTGDYPDAGASRVRERRPDVHRALAEVVARAIDAEPRRRYASAVEFGDALRATTAASPRPMGRRHWLLAAAVLLAGLALPIWWRSAPTPWQPQVELVRRTDMGAEPLRDGAELHVGDRLALELATDRPTYAYVLNEDASGAFHVLFPLAGLELSNPLAPSPSIALPGRDGRRALSWEVSSAGGREEFVVVLAQARLDAIERRLAGFESASLPDAERGVARVAAVPDAAALQGVRLNSLLAELEPEFAARGARSYRYAFMTAPR